MSRYLEKKQENLRLALGSLGQSGQPAEIANRPLLLHMEITTRCNLRCLKCGHATDPPGSQRIAPRHLQYGIIETFDEFFAAATRVHTFGYGEMFLYAKLQRLVERLKHYECMVDGITNGAIVGKPEIDWLVEYGYDELTFSIDGVEPETMQRLRGVNIEHIWKVLEYLKQRKQECGADRPRVIVNFVAQSDNYLELPALVRKLADLNIYFLGVNTLVTPNPKEDTGAYSDLYREFSLRNAPRPGVEAALEEARHLAAAANIGFAAYIDLDFLYTDKGTATSGLVQLVPQQNPEALPQPRVEKLAPNYCAYPWTSVYLHADTSARVCCYMRGSIGNVTSGDDLEQIWHHGSLLTEIREAVSKGEVHASCEACVRAGRYQHSTIDLQDIQRVLGQPTGETQAQLVSAP